MDWHLGLVVQGLGYRLLTQERLCEEAVRSTTYDDDVFEEEDHEDSRHEEDD